MDLSAQNSSYCDNIEEELSRIGVDYGEDKEMDEVILYFHSLNEMLEQKMYENKADEIFKCIPMRMEEFYDSFAKEGMDKALLNYYDPYKMFQRIMCASNEDIVLIKEMLVERARKNTEMVKPELSFIIRLKEIIDDYYKARDTSIKMVMLKEFSNDLQTIINLYDGEAINNALKRVTITSNEEDEFNEVNFDV